MALESDLVGLAIVVATKPLLLVKLACVIGVRAGFIVLRTWLEITKAAVSLQVSLFWKLILWTVAIVSLPFRILAALQRESQLKASLQHLRVELEDLILESEELEERYGRVVRERKMLEFMLTELEDDYDKTLTRLEMLEEELRVREVENLRLKETRGKDHWEVKGRRDDRDDTGRGSESLSQLINLKRSEIPCREREAALKRSLFSAMLSLFVGVTIWESKEACTPLVAALFTVVAISLATVLRFVSTISNKPAFDAIALLSLNWFILGVLSYPALPRFARFSVSPSISLAHHVVSWLGGSTRSS